MKLRTAGITAEYNPFHNGHLWQLHALRQTLGDVPVIACMSGFFVQRGVAALCDPWARAVMAVRAGADLVLRLPAWYSLRSADYFAAGSVTTLAATGLVDTLVCGAEHAEEKRTAETTAGKETQTPCRSLLQTAAWSLAKETEQQVRDLLQQGLSYGAAWETAAAAHSADATWFKGANNILALAYQKAVLQHQLPLQLLMLPRKGSGYHDAALHPPYASASAIRCALRDGVAFSSLKEVMPEESLRILIRCVSKSMQEESAKHRNETNGPKEEAEAIMETTKAPGSNSNDRRPDCAIALLRRENILCTLLAYHLSQNNSRRLYEHSSASHDLCDRFYNARQALTQGYAAFCDTIANKRDSLPAVRRLSLQLLLQQPRSFWTDTPEPSYLRVLAFNNRGRALLKEMKQTATLPIISKPGNEEQYKGTALYPLLQLDAKAADLYQMLNGNAGVYGTDFTTSPMYVKG